MSKTWIGVSEPRDVPLSLRITGSESERLKKALENETKDPRNKSLTRTELGAHLLALGLDAYFAREAAGTDRFRDAAAGHGGDEAKTFAEMLRRGLESWEAEHPRKKGR